MRIEDRTPKEKKIMIIKFKLFVQNISTKQRVCRVMPTRQKILRPLTSDKRGRIKILELQPMKNAEPIMPIFHFGSQNRSSFSTQLCNVSESV